MSARETLAMFVAGGNMRSAEPSPDMPPERVKELKQRLADINQGKPTVKATDAPSDFRAGVEARETAARARAAAKRGADVPRWNEKHPIMKRIYKVHDAIASMPTPAGISGMLLLILVLFLVLIPVTTGGPTRTLLLWDVLLGQKRVPAQTDGQATGSGLEKVAQAGQKAAQGQSMGGMVPLPTQVVSEPAWHVSALASEGL